MGSNNKYCIICGAKIEGTCTDKCTETFHRFKSNQYPKYINGFCNACGKPHELKKGFNDVVQHRHKECYTSYTPPYKKSAQFDSKEDAYIQSDIELPTDYKSYLVHPEDDNISIICQDNEIKNDINSFEIQEQSMQDNVISNQNLLEENDFLKIDAKTLDSLIDFEVAEPDTCITKPYESTNVDTKYDSKDLISNFQNAIKQEIEALKNNNHESGMTFSSGEKVHSTAEKSIYRFLFKEKSFSIPDDQPVTLVIENKKYNAEVISVDSDGFNVALSIDLGEFIARIKLVKSNTMLLEILNEKFDKIKHGELSINSKGCLKLFGSSSSNSFSKPLSNPDLSLYDFKLNTEQEAALKSSLSQEVTFIWGPPGTGKTRVLSIILDQLVRANKKVLLVSHTNLAVDEILLKYLDIQSTNNTIELGKVVRYGTPAKMDSALNNLLIENIIEFKEKKNYAQIDRLEKDIEYLQALHDAIYNNSDIQKIISKFEELTLAEKKYFSHINEVETKIKEDDLKISKLNTKLAEEKSNFEKYKNKSFLKRMIIPDSEKRMNNAIYSTENKIQKQTVKRNELQNKLSILSDKLSPITEHKSKLDSAISEVATDLNISSNILSSSKSFLNEKNRIVHEINSSSASIQKLKEELESSKQSILSNASVVGCTLTKAYLSNDILQKQFDIMILDEASMAQLPAVFLVAGLVSKSHYVIAGDFKQLPPIATGNSVDVKTWLKRDIFAQAGIEHHVNYSIDDSRLVMLREQYRMHEDIANLINHPMYHGKLFTSKFTSNEMSDVSAHSPFNNHPVVFMDTSEINPWCQITPFKSRINNYSAFLSVRLTKIALEDGIQNVGIVTPYKEQAKLIKDYIDDEKLPSERVTAATIHKFQGNEKDCVIFDVVDSYPNKKGRLLSGSFSNSDAGKLINVAVSRAKGKFIVIGNGEYITHNFDEKDALSHLIDDIKQSGKTVNSKGIVPSYFDKKIEDRLFTSNGSEIQSDEKDKRYNEISFYRIFEEELQKAEKRVVIFSPFVARRRLSTLMGAFRLLVDKGVKVYIITQNPKLYAKSVEETEMLIENIRKSGIDVIIASGKVGLHPKMHEKIALIDEHVFFDGSLNILSQSDSSEQMNTTRSIKVIKNLIKYFRIEKIIQLYESQNVGSKTIRRKMNASKIQVSLLESIGKAIQFNMEVEKCPNCNSPLALTLDDDGLYWTCLKDLKNGFMIRKSVPHEIITKSVRSMDLSCDRCKKGNMRYKIGQYGPFLSCNRYPECEYSMDLV